MRNVFVRYCFLVLVLCLFVIIPARVQAQENPYSVDYTFNFYINDSSPHVGVKLDVSLTNVRPDVYITEYSLLLPQNFIYKDLKVRDDGGTLPYVSSESDGMKKITFTFDEPEAEGRSGNHLQIQYIVENMHSATGRINEVILPLIGAHKDSRVNAILHIPDSFSRQLSISKPVPTTVGIKQIHWQQVKAQTIHALFGESQVYKTHLKYNLQNNGIGLTKKIIALPPETLYQRVYIKELNPQPARTYTDDDGNFLAEYSMLPRQNIDITFDGFVEVFVKPQSTLQDHMRQKFNQQENYLLTEEPFWRLGKMVESVDLSSLHSIEDIYMYTVNTLTYDVRRLTADPSRYGAEKALLRPKSAVCMEYTDLFIALAREKSIPAREIQGYGYSDESRIRPQSLVLDELHAWPEAYDRQQETWIPLDPTWEDTSGIDYFTSFDVNHIALAIHGRDPQMPSPAGMYKTLRRKDVYIDVSKTKPTALVDIDITSDIPASLEKNHTYTSQVRVTNTGNSFIHAIRILPEAQHIQFDTSYLDITYLAPLETRVIPMTYTPKDRYTPSDTISFAYDGNVLGSHNVRIMESADKNPYLFIGGLSAIVGIITLYIIMKMRQV